MAASQDWQNKILQWRPAKTGRHFVSWEKAHAFRWPSLARFFLYQSRKALLTIKRP
jgi:hypothetical protein